MIVKCPICGLSTYQPNENGELICPQCKCKIEYKCPTSDPIVIIIGIVGFIVWAFAMAGAFN